VGSIFASISAIKKSYLRVKVKFPPYFLGFSRNLNVDDWFFGKRTKLKQFIDRPAEITRIFEPMITNATHGHR